MNLSRFILTLAILLSISSLSAQKVALNFDGTDDYVQTTYSGISGSNARTVEAWIKTSANANPSAGGVQQVIVDYGTFATGARFTMNVLWGNALRIELSGSGLSGQTILNDTQWHHVAAVYDPLATLNYSLYVDGVLDTAGNLPTTINTGSAVNLRIGRRIDNARHFDGDIDEVRMYNFAKSDTQIMDDMNRVLCPLPTGLVGYWRLDEGLAGGSNAGKTSATDHSTNTNTGTLTNFALTGSSSNWIQGVNLTGGNTVGVIDTSTCYSYKGPSGTKTWFTTGTYTDVIANAAGCDSVITINLKILNSSSSFPVKECDTFWSPSGKLITQSGFYRDTLVGGNQHGCDSNISLFVTIYKSDTTQSIATGCDSAFAWGKWYFANTQLDSLFSNEKGCDSLHKILVLINEPSQSTQTISVCDSFELNTNTFYVSGDYYDTLQNANSNGCDSIVKWMVTVNNSYYALIAASGCDSFVSPSGIKYTSTGKYTERYTNNSNCDSILEYDVTISASKWTADTVKSCGLLSFKGTVYETSQIVRDSLKTTKGCDSLVSTYLDITIIDTMVNRVDNVLTSAQANADYQWLNCSDYAPISGETNASFAPTITGEYAVKITKNACVDTSACNRILIISVDMASNEVAFKVYPNPSNGIVNIEWSRYLNIEQIQVLDLTGKVVQEVETGLSDSLVVLDKLKSGGYLIVLSNENTVYYKRFTVK